MTSLSKEAKEIDFTEEPLNEVGETFSEKEVREEESRLRCYKCGELTLDEGQEQSLCGKCAN